MSSQRLISKWLTHLNLARQTPQAWHRARLREELLERRRAVTPLARLSESSDVFFTLHRARHDGFPIRRVPAFRLSQQGPVYAYMLAKYTLRWGFYRLVAMLCRGSRGQGRGLVSEVVNPAKDSKLDEVARRHGFQAERFRRVGRRVRWVWPLLP
jgi:hypothetical protein